MRLMELVETVGEEEKNDANNQKKWRLKKRRENKRKLIDVLVESMNEEK